MVDERHRELHEFVADRAGESYRSAFHYEADDWHTIFVREDLPDELRESIPAAIERAREQRALLREEDYPPLGDAEATTEVHEHGVIVHFTLGPNRGTLISLDRDAARRLAGFVSQCLSILRSPPTADYRARAATD